MKSIRTYHLLSLIFMVCTIGISQDKKKKVDSDNFDTYAYMTPIASYQSLVSKGFDNDFIYKKLGNSNYLNAYYDVAAYWYEKLLTTIEKEVEPDYLYRYAQCLKSLQKYDESELWMDKFKIAKAQDSRNTLFAENKSYLDEISIPSEKYRIENFMEMNSTESDFAPSYFLTGMVFSTTRDLESEVDYNDFAYSNLYEAEIFTNGKNGQLAKFSKKINTKANESSTSFSKDGKTVYFTRNNFEKNSFKRDKNGVSRLKIYRAIFESGDWKKVQELPFNNKKYSVAHPSLNSSGTKLYFVSDMPGGKGASDIYVVDVLANGEFGIPQNLGAPINTEGKETFPFIADSGTLYFASDGHPGLGGLDLFKVDLQNKQNITNLGEPINSPEDDFSMIIAADEKLGYFASNRKGGQGNDDIYRLTLTDNDCFVLIEGIAIDRDTDEPLVDTKIVAYDFQGKQIAIGQTTEGGNYSITIPCQQKQYRLSGTKENYEEGNLYMLTTPEEKTIRDTHLKMELSSKVADVGSDLAKILKLTPIYFDLNSSYLRKDAFADLDKVVDYMLRRPDIKIEVGSHTDSREQDVYNIWLSKRRAKRTVDYILSKGIDSSRISGEGYGETQLINHCSNGVPCSEKEHQLNRRSEFIVLEK